ncbi:hypothetical protein Arub01_58770 [Actinomadura rubrobrunea]|uniref:Uncharacterized protein n=1 Tax=Actinomadura rubrobrunea TaxID=115335 RepID=A0A9W6Q0B8_9ACTN|nr:hypothetical protein [Actinomadura rubrobrunea]GLW67634.1 hypothetical protein Arub01_58770 [Actinomadura rubrobrunea]
MAAATPLVHPEPTYRIYDALARLAGVRRPVTVPDPRVSADVLVHADGRRFAVLVSQADTELAIAHPDVTLPPYGARVVELPETE